ncbi:hypothetical protein Ade02nite_36090 [Paractinoplanes deccanensis]|uniref:Antitoxin VbhA domain-containing protein n=1 Tax=Paractinoplanes deccanensis TaxID=113561 RepID=A0ABQ3Y4P5_9ACTN|nr:hypothetical protein [Actinoplanes deccanensis]GID74968.1 hypothetical protein Ade02nite_36090 [Actinoplanes deccanensis]
MGTHDEQHDRAAESFESLADSAEMAARTAEMSARVHDQMTDRVAGAAEHAERDRTLAAAEWEAAAAYRAHEVPPDEVRETIRRAGTPQDAG